MKTKSVALFILIFILISIPVKIMPIIIDGYTMYQNAVSNLPLDERIDQVRTNDTFVPLESISEVFTSKVIASEDQRFYSHFGFNPITTFKAFINNLKQGKYAEGGSTITQQLAKNLYFSFDKEYERKVAELFVAFQLEQNYTKDEILELYCNIAYFGNGCYGIESASTYYYGVPASNLDEEQSEVLVKTLKSPSLFNPSKIQALNIEP